MITLEIKNHLCSAFGTGSAVIYDVMVFRFFALELVHTEENACFVGSLAESWTDNVITVENKLCWRGKIVIYHWENELCVCISHNRITEKIWTDEVCGSDVFIDVKWASFVNFKHTGVKNRLVKKIYAVNKCCTNAGKCVWTEAVVKDLYVVLTKAVLNHITGACLAVCSRYADNIFRFADISEKIRADSQRKLSRKMSCSLAE